MLKLAPLVGLSLYLMAIGSWATISPDSIRISNASKVIRGTHDNTFFEQFTVYGGTAGSLEQGTCKDALGKTCDNCTSENLPCNSQRIRPEAYLKFEFKSDENLKMYKNLKFFMKLGSVLFFPELGHYNSKIRKGQTLFFEIQWALICNALGASADCSLSQTGPSSFEFGIMEARTRLIIDSFAAEIHVAGYWDTDHNQYFTPCQSEDDYPESDAGYCSMRVLAGNQRAFIADEMHNVNFNRAPFNLRYEEFATAVTSSSPYTDIGFENKEGSFYLIDPAIRNLQSGKRYYFRFAHVDNAGNVYYYSADQSGPEKQYLNCDEHSVLVN
jgi:hypothetical protein